MVSPGPQTATTSPQRAGIDWSKYGILMAERIARKQGMWRIMMAVRVNHILLLGLLKANAWFRDTETLRYKYGSFQTFKHF
jgi:hypothetical protein